MKIPMTKKPFRHDVSAHALLNGGILHRWICTHCKKGLFTMGQEPLTCPFKCQDLSSNEQKQAVLKALDYYGDQGVRCSEIAKKSPFSTFQKLPLILRELEIEGKIRKIEFKTGRKGRPSHHWIIPGSRDMIKARFLEALRVAGIWGVDEIFMPSTVPFSDHKPRFRRSILKELEAEGLARKCVEITETLDHLAKSPNRLNKVSVWKAL